MRTITDFSNAVTAPFSLLRLWPDFAIGALCVATVGTLGITSVSWTLIIICVGILVLLQSRRCHLQEIASLKAQAQTAHVYQLQSLTALEREIRGSLNGITGYAEYIAHQATDPMIQFTGTIIHENSLRLMRSTDVMLDLMHAQGSNASCISFSIHALFSALRQEYESALNEKALLLECQIDDALAAPLRGKAHLVRKVIANLTENAIRFCETHGRIRIHAELAQDQHHVHVRVEDDGALITNDNLTALLEHADAPLLASTDHPLGDAGLSLAVAHRLALSMGGRLHHTPTMDKGNMFHFFFPLSPTE